MILEGVAPEHIVAVIDSGLFDSGWYAATYPDVASADVDPFVHFMTQGWREGRSPGPLFDLRWYAEHYTARIPDGMNPLVHYVTIGWRESLWPSAGFDPIDFGRRNPEARDLALPPLTVLVNQMGPTHG